LINKIEIIEIIEIKHFDKKIRCQQTADAFDKKFPVSQKYPWPGRVNNRRHAPLAATAATL
jgi:hypothetical protein